VYLTLDYWLGYWIRVRPKIAKQPTVVLFDRYAYDMALDPRRFRIRLPASVAGLFAELAPKPDLILCLQGDPEIIAARKRELPIEETRRQVEALRAFASKESRAVLIATDTRVSETRDQVLGTILKFLAQKHDQRYG
jgi:thymidylate kinase